MAEQLRLLLQAGLDRAHADTEKRGSAETVPDKSGFIGSRKACC
jgi:hypothetical protein